MRFLLQKLFQQSFIFLFATCAYAQQRTQSPEVAQMYKHAQEDVGRGDIKDAIVVYRQAIQIAPDNLILYKDLADLLYQSKEYFGAEELIKPLVANGQADAKCYYLLAISLEKQDKTREARSALQKGLDKFPASGLLYHEKGRQYRDDKRPESALNAWLDGIKNAPGYAPNYNEAARVYLGSDHVLWGLLYGEMFLEMEHDTADEGTLKDTLYSAYKKLFDELATRPTRAATDASKNAGNFTDAIMEVYASLTPVVSDGMSTENLTMVRTRFLMEWFARYAPQYPFSLFSCQDNMVRSGHFDMCNEWLFGKAENAAQYDAWNLFHDGDLGRFREWQAANRLLPVAGDFYNDRNMDGLFVKKKR